MKNQHLTLHRKALVYLVFNLIVAQGRLDNINLNIANRGDYHGVY